MVRIEETLFCDGCGVEILWVPVVLGRLYYCCNDCMDGYQCDCGQQEQEEERRRTSSIDTMASA